MLRYAGLGTQMLLSIGIAVFIGLKVDKWLSTLCLLACLLPLLNLAAIFLTMRQTGNNKGGTDNIND